MKFTSAIIGGLFSLSSLASARLNEEHVEVLRGLKYYHKHCLQNNGSAEYGYGMAAVMWDKHFGKKCVGGLDHIVNVFWPMVQDEVIVECYKSYYNLWPERYIDCANGAETFVQDVADECINKKDCDDLGGLAANEVSGIFCFSQELYGRRKNFFPPLCRVRAKEVCEDIAVDITQELIYKRRCPEEKKLDYKEKELLKANCKVVVKDMSETAYLERKDPYNKEPYFIDYDYDSSSDRC